METQREIGSVEVGEDNILRIILEVAQHPQQKTHVGDYASCVMHHTMFYMHYVIKTVNSLKQTDKNFHI